MKLAVYIPDETYGTDYESEENSQKFSKQLENEYNEKPKYVDIGAGASWPAFQFLIDVGPYLASALVLFFSGKKIEDNFDAWKSMAKRIASYYRHRPVFDRQAAAVLAVEAAIKQVGNSPTSIKLIGYKTTNSRAMDEHEFGTAIEGIENDDPDLQRLDGITYWFDIEADGRRFQAWVEWDEPPHLEAVSPEPPNT